MGAGYYILFTLMIVFGFVGLIFKLQNISDDGASNMLDQMYKNGDITETVYKKYKFKK